MSIPILAITSGEPAGIGPDICLALAKQPLPCRCVVLADKQLLTERARQLGFNIPLVDYPNYQVPKGSLEVLHISTRAPVQAGILDPQNAYYVLDLLNRAYEGVQNKEFNAMVTAPLHKGVINEAGIPFSGHTEYLAHISQTKKVVMMLVGGGLRVALATTHLPLKDVAQALNQHELTEVIQILHHDLKTKFGLANPRIIVAGLNPHAGEGGYLGTEEITIITPVIQKLQPTMNIQGPFPADTIFQPFLLQNADAVLTMYHDQGLPVLKYASFGKGMNITLGLPFIRTSVDHGTALDLAGTGQAKADSLFEVIQTTYALLNHS
ncbi:4-hydroxythreonine-4-phosphate dehydrogenase PdxA [Neisseria sp. Ec49-e6-T10]|uniref:4-hydroxythreonine-4-phosphate dehydrogenase PdxA n=1 Tax=Neisseria sp. Ec49-e6-T10 TaxID=3140744 RepID=UPI003EBD8518